MNVETQLSDSEWDLMKILWSRSPANVNQIAEETPQWHPKTVRTMLLRLNKKGMVDTELINGIQHYRPLFARDQCELHAANSFLNRVFDGALAPMVAHFTQQKKLSAAERQALIDLLKDSKED
jgi:BlaI family transcriptional regulator, penicillinase repressor